MFDCCCECQCGNCDRCDFIASGNLQNICNKLKYGELTKQTALLSPLPENCSFILLIKLIAMTESISRVQSPAQFQEFLKNIYEEMLTCEEKGQYVEANNLREKAILQKRKWDEAFTNDMINRHNTQLNQLEKDYNSQIEQCTREWNDTIEKYLASRAEQMKQIDRQNKKEIEELRRSMTEQWPSKVKESHELLNLRQMEHHMSKQKDFYQANLIQQRINKLYEDELKGWLESRDTKIEQAVSNLRSKHNKDRDLLNKKVQVQVQDYNNRCRNDKISLQQRHNLNVKEAKARHEREVLSFRREFKTKGGLFSQKFESSD